MPSTLTYPGVYIEEIPSGVRTIVGVSTSDTAFVDFFARGPINRAMRITSFADFERTFGGLDTRSAASYAIQQYFLNGGAVAWVIRVAAGNPQPARLTLRGGSPLQNALDVQAANEGVWGQNLQVAVDNKTTDAANLFNLIVREVRTVNGRKQVVNSEIHRNLGMNTTKSSFAPNVVNASSSLIQVTSTGLGQMPFAPPGADFTQPSIVGDAENTAFTSLTGNLNDDGTVPDSAAFIGDQATTGMFALNKIAPFIFNILCLPSVADLNTSSMSAVLSKAQTFCETKRAFLIVDIPTNVALSAMPTWAADNGISVSKNAAVYFPRLDIPDAQNDNRLLEVGASGTMAGVYARTDATRGVWKAPAGVDAVLRGASLAETLTDEENGALNPFGVNVLRNFPIFGNVAWGARTMEGADLQASEWKYIPVRRTALYIEESLYQGLKWVVFEPNDEPLWAQIRLNVGAFMQNLFRQGAFQGKTPSEAYFVKCDKTTTTQDDINRGIVNIVVGFAPLKPAEFVVIKIQQIAGQVQT
ncbi:MAG: phage tail sheath subtilisin-like domain-containing protein [Chloroflexi bacterium]|nr:phage tail sheath subtilisin-like domain-containing protein [Chloroflexota bacterium]